MKTLLLLLTMLLLCGFISDNALHPPPDCGPYDYEDFTPAAANFPAVGATYTDPIFGETFTRLTNVYPGSDNGSGIMQPVNGYWNSNSTYFIHDTPSAGVDVINPSTGATVRSNVPFSGTGNLSFDPLDSDSYYYNSGTSLLRYSVSGNSSTTVKNFGTTLGDLGSNSSDWIDKTGNIFLLNLGGNFRIWKKSTDTLYTGSVTVPTGGSDNVPPGWIGLSPDGNYVVVSLGNTSTSPKTSYAINHGTTTLSTTGVVFWDALGFSDHGDVVSASDGNTYMIVAQNQYTLGGTNRHIFRVLVTNNASGQGAAQLTQTGNQVLVSLPNNTSNTVGNGHMSCAAKGTYQDWCYVAIEDPSDALGSPGTWYPYKSELLFVHVLPPFEVRRIMHHRARPYRGFCRASRPIANWDGTKMMLTSPFSATDPGSPTCGYSDLYRWDAHE